MKNKSHTHLLTELNVRRNVRKIILEQVSANFKQEYKEALFEAKLRNLIQEVLLEVKIADQVPHQNTGINLLTELLKKIVKLLETGYKTLTTSPEQRKSYRAHIINAVIGAIAPPRAINRADIERIAGRKISDLDSIEFSDSPAGDNSSLMPDAEPEEAPLDFTDDSISLQEIVKQNLLEALKVDIQGNDVVSSKAREDDGIIDLNGTEDDPRDSFTVNKEQDLTGRNIAYETFRKIESDIIDSYMMLSNDEDRQMYYIYLLVNIMLYFDRFENELQATLKEPNLETYTDEKKSDQEVFDIDNIT